jgi:hypothetical protein
MPRWQQIVDRALRGRKQQVGEPVGACDLGANQGENWCAVHGANWLIGEVVCDRMRGQAKTKR